MQEARFAGACQDQHAGRPAPGLGWPGEGNQSVQFQKSLGGHLAKGNQSVQQAKVTGAWDRAGLGPRAWGQSLQGLGARALRGLGQATRAAWRQFFEAGKKVGARARDTLP